MTAPVPLLKPVGLFVQCLTQPGWAHFQHFILAHAALWGAPHCVTETLRLLSLTLRRAEAIEAEPWWHPAGPPSVTRLRRAVCKALGISCSLLSNPQTARNSALSLAAQGFRVMLHENHAPEVLKFRKSTLVMRTCRLRRRMGDRLRWSL